jgi:WXG100 family type VII secretion target
VGRSVEVVVSELQAAAERLRDAGQRLQDGLSGVDLETRQLLGSGWKGDAASAYGPAWDQWHTGAGQVIRGLQTMADLLNLAGKEYAKTDEQSGEALNATMQGGGSTVGGGGGGGSVPGAPSAGLSAPVADLAQQMNLDQLSSAGQSAGSVPGQLGGFVAQATQMAGEVAGQVTQMVEGAIQSGQEPPEPSDRDPGDRNR